MKRLTASSLDRAAACPASEALPHARSDTPWSSLGTSGHAVLQAAQGGGLEDAPIVTKVSEYSGPSCVNEGCEQLAMTPGGTCDLCALEADYSERRAG